MKILLITNMYPVPDYIYFGIHVKEQIEALSKYNKHINSEVYFINGRKNPFNYLKSIYLINSLISNNKYDIIHIHFGMSGLFILFNPFPKIPVVLTIHGSDINSNRMGGIMRVITKLVVKRSKRVIVMNDEMAEKLNAPNNKVVKIPCGIDLQQFKPISIDESNFKELTIGFPGDKTRPVKNFQLFNDIIRMLAINRKVKIIEFHNMTRLEVVQNLNKIDLLLLTSISEGSPQIIKEAMACNKPIVTTAVGDTSDLLFGVENCYVINSFNPKDFISPIEKITKLAYNQRKSNGRDKLFKMRLDSSSIAKEIIELYKGLV